MVHNRRFVLSIRASRVYLSTILRTAALDLDPDFSTVLAQWPLAHQVRAVIAEDTRARGARADSVAAAVDSGVQRYSQPWNPQQTSAIEGGSQELYQNPSASCRV